MAKRLLAFVLCLIMLASTLVGCAKKEDEDYKGAYINMYLTDMVYDFDPAHAYDNESNLRVISLLFDNLFVLDEKGKVKKSLAKDYRIIENELMEEYKMVIELNETSWTDGIKIAADDVVFAWKRIIENASEAASLLFDIKNARALKLGEGEWTIDDLGVCALNEREVEITFEGKIDYDQFLLNLTSYALVPLREEIVTKTEDWAKKPMTMVSSGPFRIREISYEEEDAHVTLERNIYYYRDIMEDPIDESVLPYRLIIDYTMTDEEIMQAYNDGKIFYVGDIPLSVRGSYKDEATVMNSLSTHTYVLNQNAVIKYYHPSLFEELSSNACVYDQSNLKDGDNGEKIFANADVRRALSLAINRDAIAEAVVFAEAASAFVPGGVFESNSAKETFRDIGGKIIATDADMDAAQALLEDAGVDPTKFMFAISVASYDDVHMAIAEKVQEAWEELGFHVAINAIDVQVNDEKLKTTGEVSTDIKDDIFAEAYRAGNFEVAAVDYHAYSVDAFGALARFAKNYSGQGYDINDEEYPLIPHKTGYDSEEYNDKIGEAFEEKDVAARADILHEAEKMLLEDMPVIPIIFNKQATLMNDDLSKVKTTYYVPAIFTDAKLKDWENYIPAEEE